MHSKARSAAWRAQDIATARRMRRKIQRHSGQVGESLRIYGRPIVTMASDSRISLGDRVVLTSRSHHTALGIAHPVVLRTMQPGAHLIIGDDVGASGASICCAQRVQIGNGSLLGADCVIADTNFHPVGVDNRRYAAMPVSRPEDAIVIGENVFIGTRAVILPGSRIGPGAVVGAGAVVRGHVPPRAIVVGNPASVHRVWDYAISEL